MARQEVQFVPFTPSAYTTNRTSSGLDDVQRRNAVHPRHIRSISKRLRFVLGAAQAREADHRLREASKTTTSMATLRECLAGPAGERPLGTTEKPFAEPVVLGDPLSGGVVMGEAAEKEYVEVPVEVESIVKMDPGEPAAVEPIVAEPVPEAEPVDVVSVVPSLPAHNVAPLSPPPIPSAAPCCGQGALPHVRAPTMTTWPQNTHKHVAQREDEHLLAAAGSRMEQLRNDCAQLQHLRTASQRDASNSLSNERGRLDHSLAFAEEGFAQLGDDWKQLQKTLEEARSALIQEQLAKELALEHSPCSKRRARSATGVTPQDVWKELLQRPRVVDALERKITGKSARSASRNLLKGTDPWPPPRGDDGRRRSDPQRDASHERPSIFCQELYPSLLTPERLLPVADKERTLHQAIEDRCNALEARIHDMREMRATRGRSRASSRHRAA